jgi:hypothetical protein
MKGSGLGAGLEVSTIRTQAPMSDSEKDPHRWAVTHAETDTRTSSLRMEGDSVSPSCATAKFVTAGHMAGNPSRDLILKLTF